MFCGKCGNQVADEAKFCPKCGNKMQAAAGVPVVPSEDTKPQEQAVSPVVETKQEAKSQAPIAPPAAGATAPVPPTPPAAEPPVASTSSAVVPQGGPTQPLPTGADPTQPQSTSPIVPQQGTAPVPPQSTAEGQVPQKKRSKKPFIIAAAAAVVLALVGGGVAFALNVTDNPVVALAASSTKTFNKESATVEYSLTSGSDTLSGELSWKWGSDLKTSTVFLNAAQGRNNLNVLLDENKAYTSNGGKVETVSEQYVDEAQTLLDLVSYQLPTLFKQYGIKGTPPKIDFELNNIIANNHVNDAYLAETANKLNDDIEALIEENASSLGLNMDDYNNDSGAKLFAEFNAKVFADKATYDRVFLNSKTEGGFLGFGEKSYRFDFDAKAYLQELKAFLKQKASEDASLKSVTDAGEELCDEGIKELDKSDNMSVWHVEMTTNGGELKSLDAAPAQKGKTNMSFTLKVKDYSRTEIDQSFQGVARFTI